MSEEKKGLYQKYKVLKADGSEPKGTHCYFVLDIISDDPAQREACREALKTYAEGICKTNLPLAIDLIKLLNSFAYPDWCQIGSLVYAVIEKKFGRISNLSEHGAFCDFFNGGGAQHLTQYFMPAHMREWNVDDMHRQLGKKFVCDGEIVTAKSLKIVHPGDPTLMLETDKTSIKLSFTAKQMFQRCKTMHGEICGTPEVINA